MADEDGDVSSKSHRKKQAGPKAEKKKKKRHSPEDASAQRNPRAFSFKSAVRASRQFRRKQDAETKKHHEPTVDRTPLEPPPYIIAVVGPPKVGKTTLINSLLKNFTRQQLSDVKGPVTVVSGRFTMPLIVNLKVKLVRPMDNISTQWIELKSTVKRPVSISGLEITVVDLDTL